MSNNAVHFYLCYCVFSRPSMLSKEAASNEKWRFPIWPEWNDADINAEKWDTGKAGKEKPVKGQISVSCVTHIISTSFLYLYLIQYLP